MTEPVTESAGPEKKWYGVHTYSGYEQKAKAALEERARALLDRFGLSDKVEAYPAPLSGGARRLRPIGTSGRGCWRTAADGVSFRASSITIIRPSACRWRTRHDRGHHPDPLPSAGPGAAARVAPFRGRLADRREYGRHQYPRGDGDEMSSHLTSIIHL